MFLAKYNNLGSLQWLKLKGGPKNESGNAIALDAEGNIYVTGYTESDFDNQTVTDKVALLLMKYNPNGEHQWTSFYNSDNILWANDEIAEGNGIAIDSSNNIFVAGTGTSNNGGIYSFLLLRYRSDGTLYGGNIEGKAGPQDKLFGVATTTNYVYAVGNRDSTLHVKRYNLSDPNDIKSVTISDCYASGIALDSSNNVYIVGYTEKALDGQTIKGGKDILLIKYDNTLTNRMWTRLIGGNENDYGKKVTVDSSGNIYVVGYTKSSFHGQSSNGEFDAVVMKYSSGGDPLWTKFIGGSANEDGCAVRLDNTGKIYVAGATKSSFGDATNKGYYDGFLSKIIP